MVEYNARGQVITWLATGCLLVFLMVVIGGITRLTGSGLSITDWKLVAGAVPPMSEAAWQESFEAYQSFPEFQIQPASFSLSDYKQIFWWEYIHRALGRLIGIVFLLPFIYFLIRKKISGPLIWKLLILFSLGGLQGFFGWYMVKSGLMDDPHVSHYRLAIHLVTALLTFTYTFWLILEILFPKKLAKTFKKEGRVTVIFILLVLIQIIWGAFTAGLKAGLFYNSYPMMGDDWIPEGVYAMTPLYLNFIEGIGGVQFVHRWLGTGLLFFALYYILLSRRMAYSNLLRAAIQTVGLAILIQVLLGIFTLILKVPLALAVLHQVGAFILLMTLMYALRVSKYEIS